MTLTLEKLHKDLNIKQGLKNYVRNTNKKYGQNWLATEVLDKETYMLIKLNTLGKLGRHSQQTGFVTGYMNMEETVKTQHEQIAELKNKAEAAMKIIDKDNLKEAYIETLKEKSEFDGEFGITDRVVAFMASKGVRYGEYMTQQGVRKFFKDRIEWFEKELVK